MMTKLMTGFFSILSLTLLPAMFALTVFSADVGAEQLTSQPTHTAFDWINSTEALVQACRFDSDCFGFDICKFGRCQRAECYTDRDCGGNRRCFRNRCQ